MLDKPVNSYVAVYITVSTGVGCGIIIDGRIYQGTRGNAGEFGHICVQPGGVLCSCGNRGCLEAYCSGSAIERISGHDAKTLAKAARDGAAAATAVWNEMGARLGQGISILIQLLDPEVIVLGGGVSNDYDLFEQSLMSSVKEHTYGSICPPGIRKAELAPLSGIYGMGKLACNKYIL